MLDLQAIQARAASRLARAPNPSTPANPANVANAGCFISQLATLATPARRDRGRYGLTLAECDVAHAEPWDDAAIARFQARAGRFQRLGFSEQDADDLAGGLHLRDVHADYRHLCLECRHLAGHQSTGWRCRNHRIAAVAPLLPAELVTLSQHCPGFAEVAS